MPGLVVEGGETGFGSLHFFVFAPNCQTTETSLTQPRVDDKDRAGTRLEPTALGSIKKSRRDGEGAAEAWSECQCEIG